MPHVANVVGMVVSIQKGKGAKGAGNDRQLHGANSDNFGKLFFDFPEEKDCDALYLVKMLMLDG